MKLTLKLFALLLFGTLISQAQTYVPSNGNWEHKTPADLNLKSDKLEAAVDFAMENEYSEPRDLRLAILKGFEKEPFHEITGPTKKRGGPAGIILKNGYIIAQWGDVNRVDMTFSVTKSFLSTTALLALEENLIANTAEPVINYVWDGTFNGEHNRKITWQHLLNQSSDWSGELWGGYDWADRPPSTGGLDDWKNRTLNEPGTVFKYNDVRVNLLAYSLLQVWRKPLPQVLKEKIMDPIGASSTWRWYGYNNAWINIDGIEMQSVTGGGHSGGGMFINTEDMARFGLLFSRNGKWKGEQLLSENLIEQALRPSKANSNYGYMWWLNQKGSRHWKGLPEDLFYAAGFGGNFIVIDRQRDLVIITRWLEPSKIEEFINKVYQTL
ncbi:MAG TPA: serine hydrolase [Gillisia sp.]|nr:serine hydrolase [Gillisia sp.]